MAEKGLMEQLLKGDGEQQKMAARPTRLKQQSDAKEAKPTDTHSLGPLTINTQSLESFGLGPHYTELQPIGFGVHGLVVSALDRTTRKRVAAKKIKVESQQSCKYALREVRVMCQMRHENIVRVMDVVLEDGSGGRGARTGHGSHSEAEEPSGMFQMYIVSELLDTNLHVLISQKLLEADHVTLITYQLVRGLHYLRSANVVHRDLKPSNLFINCDTLLLKIGDFGLARIVDPLYSHSGYLTADLGTYWYRAPELMLTRRSYTPAVDMWSAGCILGEMLLGKPLFTGASDCDQLRHILDAVELTEQDWSAVLHILPNRMLHQHPLNPQRPLAHRLNDVSPLVIDLLENMLVFDPHQRLTPERALSHHYLQPYAKPDKEPIAAHPFGIEAEVDDLPIEKLKKMIYEENKSRRGKRGSYIPLPSPVDRPKISSATLSLKTSIDKSPKQVQTSPTFDAIMQEQRRNRRNKMSASVDLSFISLPTTEKPQKHLSAPNEPEQVVYTTSSFDTKAKQPSPACPWKWPISKAEEKKSSPNPPIGDTGDSSGATAKMEELIFKHVPEVTTKKMSSSSLNDKPSPPPGFSSLRSSREPKVEFEAKVRRMKPKKRGFVDVGGFDDEDYIHLGIQPDSDTRRHSVDPLSLGKIETYEEKDQARIDRELNRKNRTSSMDLSYITVPNVHYAPVMPQVKSTVVPRSRISSETLNSSVIGKISSANSVNISKTPPMVKHHEPSRPSASSSPLLGDGLLKRSSDVGIRIIRSPKPQRKLDSGTHEYRTSAVTPTETQLSTAVIECPSPMPVPERKISVTSIDSSRMSSRPASREDSSQSSVTSYINRTPVSTSQSFYSAFSSRSTSISPLHGRQRTQGDKDNGDVADMSSRPIRIGTPTDQKDVTGSRKTDHRMSLYESGDDLEVFTGNTAKTDLDDPEDNPERPPSVVSTLTIPPLSPVPDIPYSPRRKVSQTTLFLDDVSVNREISQIDCDGNRSASAEPPRCSSRLSVDLSFINKELQKWEEEEKDKVEVSPRKLQEDWEIESQASQKSEWTLSEILGVPEEEMQRTQQEQQPVVPTASASVYRSPEMSQADSGSSSGTRKISRTKIDLIPYRVLTPDSAQKPRAFTHLDEGPSKSVPNKDCKSPTAKLEELSLDVDRKKFTTEYFIGSTSSASRGPVLGKDFAREQTANLKDCSKEHLYLDFKTPHTQKVPHSISDTSSASVLAKFSHYKSEEDLVSPRSHSPRDILGARAAMPRDVADLPGFKQSVKENLSSLSVSIPKDFPEKRRLIKAHSTESVCSEGDSSQKSQEPYVMDRSTEDLIQFSPVGGSKAESQHWSDYKDDQGTTPECNHCLYRGHCKASACGDTSHVSLQRPLTPQKPDLHAPGHLSVSEDDHHQQHGGSSRSGMRSSLDELCYSKHVFNEQQKLLRGANSEQDPSPSGDSNVQYLHRRARPKSAKH